MTCYIIDDEEMAIKVIENHISHIDGLSVEGVFFNAMDAFGALQKKAVDIIFLDIQMPKMSGLSLLKSLPINPHVIITTAHREFALDGFELNVVDYLLKPISFDRFIKSLGKVYRLENNAEPTISKNAGLPISEPAFFYIKSERQYVKILLEDVLYIESLRNHVKIVTTKGNHTTLQGISQMEDKLPPQHFLRIHRSFIISLSKINRFSQTNLTVGEQVIPIGNHYREEVLKRLSVDLI